jgi:hypothetical protein
MSKGETVGVVIGVLALATVAVAVRGLSAFNFLNLIRTRPRWVEVFRGEYRRARRVMEALEDRRISTELTFPEEDDGSVLIRVLESDEMRAKSIIAEAEAGS